MEKFSENLQQFNYLQNEIMELYHEASVRLGVSDSVMCILYMLYENGEYCLQSKIYKQSGISRQTINSAIKKMEKDGIVYLKQGTGRNTVVHLTEVGKQFAVEKVAPIYQIETEIYNEWTTKELLMYLELTKRYRDQFKEKIKEL